MPADPGLPRHMLATLRHRDFRLLWLGQLVSTVGDMMQSIGISWHLYVLTSSPLQLGLLGLIRAVPFMALSLAGGAMADSMDRKRLLIVSQVAQMAFAGVLAAATATGHVTVWLLYGATFLTGAASAFDSPTRQAMVPNLVPRREMVHAMTLLTLMRRTAMIAGPGLGGLVISAFGLAPDYFGNAISFLAVVVAVLVMGPVPKVVLTVARPMDRITGGFHFARREPKVMVPMLMDFVTRSCGSAGTLLPVFARDVFFVGAEGLGVLSSAMSAGAVAGGLLLGSLPPSKRPITLMMAAYTLEGLFFAGFGLSRLFGLGLIMLFLKGVANIFGEVLRTTVLQLKTPDDVRGRVTALSGIFDNGGPQIGALEAGAVGEAIGPIGSVISSGIAGGVLAAVFWLHPSLRDEPEESSDHLSAAV